MPLELTPRQRIMLGALATARGGKFAPVQIQKLFFLIDENLADRIGGPYFAFEPYDYGPFDKSVYRELEALAIAGLVAIDQSGDTAGRRRYSHPRGTAPRR